MTQEDFTGFNDYSGFKIRPAALAFIYLHL